MYLENIIKLFNYYKSLGEKTFSQLDDDQLFICPNNSSNSIAIIVQHLAGNMLSRWTDFFDSDGEKDWRNRETEFDVVIKDRENLIKRWNEGWACLFNVLDNLTADDLEKKVLIRNEKHTVVEAINRQLTHYSFHVGQLVYLGKYFKKEAWNSLSIPRGKSEEFNKKMFSK